MKRAVRYALAAMLCAASGAGAQPRRSSADAEAREHFRRGVERTDEGQFDAAMAEFTAAYELTRDPRILYNIAVTHEARGDAASALLTLERFAREAPPRAVRAQQADLDATRARLLTRVATVVVEVNAPGLEVRIDGAPVPLGLARAGVPVNLGRRRIALTAPGWQPYERVVDLASGAREVVRDGMRRITSTVAVECDVPDAEVLVDGARVATTPVEAPVTVPEGPHTVEVRRAGYTTFSRAIEARGVGVRVRAELAWAPLGASDGARLVVRASEPAVVASLDGHRIATDGSEPVPPGRHRLTVSTERFMPAERDVVLTPGATHEERVVLVPTPAFRAEYMADAARARRAADWIFWPGLALTVAGAASVAAGVVLMLDADDRYDAAHAQAQRCDQTALCDSRAFNAEATAADNDGVLYRGVAIAGGVAAAAGIGGIVVGTVLHARAPRLDRFPAVALTPTAGGASLGLSGSF